MDAVSRHSSWTAGRVIAIALFLMAVAVVSGGLGGYLIRGTSTLVVTRTIHVPAAAPVQAPYFNTDRSSAGQIPGL